MHETTTTVKVYADGDFRIVIVETKDMYEYWLNHIEIGKAEMQFGLYKKDVTYEELKIIIENDLEDDEEQYLANMQIEEHFWNQWFKEENE